MALSIILADPDEKWLKATASFFEQRQYQVAQAKNGKQAQLIIYNGEFFACILNLNLANHSALEVLKFIKTSHKVKRIVIIVENADALVQLNLTEEKLLKLGANDVLTKPFDLSQLLDVMEGHQTLDDLIQTLPLKKGQSAEVEVQSEDKNFCSIKMQEFLAGKSVLFDVYIKLGENKYVKILHSGDTFSRERLDFYRKEKGLNELFFMSSDRRKYIQYLNFVTDSISKHKDASDATKVKMVNTTTGFFLDEVYTEGLRPQVVEQAKQLGNSVFELVQHQTDLWKILREWHVMDPNGYSHSTAVMIFASATIQQFEWQSKAMTQTMAMAALLHDIGKTKLPSELVRKRPKDMTHEETLLYQTHPSLGSTLLDNHMMVDQSVRQIVLQHHEAFDGSGFPNKLKANKVLMLANILGLCDDFVHELIDTSETPIMVLQKLLKDKIRLGKYNSMIMENFIKVFADQEKKKIQFNLPSNSRVVTNKRVS